MARLNIHIATNAKGPAKQRVIGMYVIELIDDGKLDTKEGMLIRESSTGKELTLMLMINALFIVAKMRNQYESLSLYTNEQLVESALLNKWIEKWQESDWKNAKGKEVAHADLWQQATELINSCCEKMIWCGKHEFNPQEQIKRDSSYLSWMEIQCKNKEKEISDKEKVESMIEKFKEKMDNA